MKRLTKSQYEVIAQALAEALELCKSNPLPARTKADTVKQAALHIADTLSKTDYTFDKQKFLKQCGIED